MPTCSLFSIEDNQHYTVDRLTGEMTERPFAGVNTATTKFMSYGADGLLHVLDYGNNHIASFDPDLGAITANEQFAIGINGNFYLTAVPEPATFTALRRRRL